MVAQIIQNLFDVREKSAWPRDCFGSERGADLYEPVRDRSAPSRDGVMDSCGGEGSVNPDRTAKANVSLLAGKKKEKEKAAFDTF